MMHKMHIFVPGAQSYTSLSGRKLSIAMLLFATATISILGIATSAYAQEVYIEENNSYELDQESFWRIAHKIDKHVIIEMYTSATWCGKYLVSRQGDQKWPF